jgi:hypothetical protein
MAVNICNTFWFHKVTNGKKIWCSKSISIGFYSQHWKILNYHNNGAVKVKDSCFDCTLNFFGLRLSYTNWDYNRKR